MTADRSKRFEQSLASFPEPVRPLLAQLPDRGGKLDCDTCQELLDRLEITPEMLMVRLLPLARVFAGVPISAFPVGAVALAENRLDPTKTDLYLGANLEFAHMALGVTIHAEQSAVMNAWHQDSGRLLAVATSETPCGHCRQFLHEVYGGGKLAIVQPAGRDDRCLSQPISDLLPQAFTPSDLGMPSALLAPSRTSRCLRLKNDADDPDDPEYPDDPLVRAALRAAEAAHTPYSRNFSGCALKTRDNRVVSGRSMESVAFNPSVSPLHSAIIRLNLMRMGEQPAIDRVVLVERPAKIRQKEYVQMLVNASMPDVMLEYHIVQEETQ